MTTFRDWFNAPRSLDTPLQPDEAQSVVDSLRRSNPTGADQPTEHMPTEDDRGCSCGWAAPGGDQFARAYVGHLLTDTEFDFPLPAGGPCDL